MKDTKKEKICTIECKVCMRQTKAKVLENVVECIHCGTKYKKGTRLY